MTGIDFTDVTLRDGLQMESRVFSLDQKVTLLRALAACGYSRIEVTSFVNPTKMPQFADAPAFCEKIYQSPQGLPPLMGFVPNVRGAQELLKTPIPWVACFVSVSEAFNKRNVNATINESLAQVASVVQAVRAARRKVRVYISTVFGCPYQGAIEPATLSRVFEEVATFGPDEIALGDTIGVATPSQVRSVLALLSRVFPLEKVAAHLHNTYGLGIATARAAFECGIQRFDGSTGGVGGCPYAKGASGNLPSEDLLYTFFRDGLVSEFRAKEIQLALQVLKRDMGLELQGALSSVWQKGGDWYGV